MPKPPQDALAPKIGSWSFIFGVIVAIVTAFISVGDNYVSVLIVLGLLVGILNIRGQEALTFLLATVSLVVITSLGGEAVTNVQLIGIPLQKVFNNMIIFIIPASTIVAFRVVLTIAYKKSS
jgi:hypothetical protein